MKKSLFFILMFSFFSIGNSSAQTFWKKYFMSNGVTGSVQQSFDNGFIFVNTLFLTGGVGSIYIVKTDMAGDTLWTRIFDDGVDTNSSRSISIQNTIDSCYIVAGRWETDTVFFSPGIYLIKLDRAGNILWNKVLRPDSTVFSSIDFKVNQTYDKGFIILASLQNHGQHIIIKTDSLGDPQWVKKVSGQNAVSQNLFGSEIHQTRDSGYIVLSNLYVSTNIDNVSLIKMDKDGNIQWSKLYSDFVSVTATNIYETSDSGYILNTRNKLIKTSFTGDTVWTRGYGTAIENIFIGGFSICSNSDLIFFGSYSDTSGNYGNVLFKTDSIGHVKWTRRITNATMAPTSVKQLSNKDFIVFGWNETGVNSNEFSNLIRTDSNGYISCNLDTSSIQERYINISYNNLSLIIDTDSVSVFFPNAPITHGDSVITNCISTGINNVVNKLESLLYPNPSKGKFYLKNIELGSEIIIFNLLGKIVHQSINFNSNTIIDLTYQPKGIYFCKIISKDNIGETFKILLQ